MISIDTYQVASRFIGVAEVPGAGNNPHILAMLQLDDAWPEGDEVPWCSAFCNYVCWLLGLPRSKKLNARSWLEVGYAVTLDEAQRGDVVILTRGKNPAHGHVGFFGGTDGKVVTLLGGNQGDSVCLADFPVSRIINIRRLW